MQDTSNYLSGKLLKDKAKEILTGNYTQAALVVFLIGLLSLAAQFLVEFSAGFLFALILIVKEMSSASLTSDQMLILLQNTEYIKQYMDFYAVLEYIFVTVSAVFTAVFNVGFSLFCLNLCCHREAHITDIFYGFRRQFGKSLAISAVFVLVSQLYALPANLLNFFLNQKADLKMALLSLAILAIGVCIYIPLSLSISQAYLLLLDVPERSASELIKLSVQIMQGHKMRLFLVQLSFLPLMLLSLCTIGIANLWLTPFLNVTCALFFLNLMQTRAAA